MNSRGLFTNLTFLFMTGILVSVYLGANAASANQAKLEQCSSVAHDILSTYDDLQICKQMGEAQEVVWAARAWAYGAYSFSLARLKKYEEALSAAETAILISPDSKNIHDSWGRKMYALLKLKRYSEVKRTAQMILFSGMHSTDKNFIAATHIELAFALITEGKFEQALISFDEAKRRKTLSDAVKITIKNVREAIKDSSKLYLLENELGVKISRP